MFKVSLRLVEVLYAFFAILKVQSLVLKIDLVNRRLVVYSHAYGRCISVLFGLFSKENQYVFSTNDALDFNLPFSESDR